MRSPFLKTCFVIALLSSLEFYTAAQPPASQSSYEEALSLIRRQQIEPGVALLRKILGQSPNDIKAHNLLGIALTAAEKIEEANTHFQKAIELTSDRTGPKPRDKLLLVRTLMGYRLGLVNNDQKFFHDQLKQVLETPPSVWPEQRLANEVAHRRARRYLSHEKELFQ